MNIPQVKVTRKQYDYVLQNVFNISNKTFKKPSLALFLIEKPMHKTYG